MKMDKKFPPVDLDMLTMALQAGELDTTWWLDRHSGQVLPAPESEGDALEQKLIKKKQRSPDRYIDIEPVAGEVHLELMESYLAIVNKEIIRELLEEALQRKSPEWHFKKALAKCPESEDNWYAYKDQFYALQARQWLRDRDLHYHGEPSADEVAETGKSKESEQPHACLQLTLNKVSEIRRYMVWQQEQHIMLTAIVIEGNRDEEILSETQINEHQLLGINRIIASYNPGIDLMPVLDQRAGAILRFSSQASRGEIQGEYTDDSIFRQLADMLDMILGIPAIQP